MLSNEEKEQYIRDVIIPNFMHFIEQKVFSTIYDCNLEVVIATNYTAQSVGFDSWQEICGISYKNYDDPRLLMKVFGDSYNEKTSTVIHQYLRKIYQIQQMVFKSQKIISYIDLLPYLNQFKSYLVTHIPLYHQNGEVVAIQSFASQAKFFSHQDYLQQLITDSFQHKYKKSNVTLTEREHEIMFLLANSISQEQIAQILAISRSTVATIIGKLSAKFGIHGSHTKLLGQIAIQNNYYQDIPLSLYQPYIIFLDDDILAESPLVAGDIANGAN